MKCVFCGHPCVSLMEYHHTCLDEFEGRIAAGKCVRCSRPVGGIKTCWSCMRSGSPYRGYGQ